MCAWNASIAGIFAQKRICPERILWPGRGYVPQELSVIGMNDIPSASYASVPLTTISTYTPEMVRQSVKMLPDHMKRRENHMIQNIRVTCRLIVRDTTTRVQGKEAFDTITMNRSASRGG